MSLREQGNAAFSVGKLEEAEALYSQAIDADGEDHKSYSNRSLVRRQLLKFDEALADAESSLENDPLYVKAHDRKITALVDMNRLWEARKACAYAVNLFKKSSKPDAKDALDYFKIKLSSIRSNQVLVAEDLNLNVSSLEHFSEIFKHCENSRLKLAAMATMWNQADKKLRLAVFTKFLLILTGNDQVPVDASPLVDLPMHNYADVKVPSTWLKFWNSTEDKVGMFHEMYQLCTKDEQNLIIIDLKEYFQPKS